MVHRNLISVLVLALASVLCWQGAQSAPKDDSDAELYRLFVDALEHVDRNYVKNVDRRQLIEAAINGMLESLDPYSNFIDPEHFRHFERQTKGNFSGIGVQISKPSKDAPVTIISPLAGSPAYDAGILAGDQVRKVNGESVDRMTLSEVVERILGESGSKVTLTIQHRPYTEPSFDVTLTRALINIESVLGDRHVVGDKWDFIIDKGNKIAYVRVNAFMLDTKKDLEKVCQQLIEEGMKALVLDLRYNPGGLLTSSVEVSDLFVDGSKYDGKIVSTKGRNTLEKHYTAHKEGTLPPFPMAILVNQFSASASEIVSACLQDHERCVIVGERTWGKGSVQNVIELEDGKSALKLTTAGYFRPNGHNIHRFDDSKPEDEWGVQPTTGFEVKFSDEEHRRYMEWRQRRDRIQGKTSPDGASQPAEGKEEPFEDRQLARAMEYLLEQIGAKPAVKAAQAGPAAPGTPTETAKAKPAAAP